MKRKKRCPKCGLRIPLITQGEVWKPGMCICDPVDDSVPADSLNEKAQQDLINRGICPHCPVHSNKPSGLYELSTMERYCGQCDRHYFLDEFDHWNVAPLGLPPQPPKMPTNLAPIVPVSQMGIYSTGVSIFVSTRQEAINVMRIRGAVNEYSWSFGPHAPPRDRYVDFDPMQIQLFSRECLGRGAGPFICRVSICQPTPLAVLDHKKRPTGRVIPPWEAFGLFDHRDWDYVINQGMG